MIVYAKISGDTVILAPDTTVQGSIGANVIDLLAPFPKTAAVSVAVTLPTGQSTTPTFAGAKDATLITGNVSGIEEDGKELNIWRYTFQKPLTQFAGSLTVQFYVTTSDATTALTPLIVPIVKGVPFIMPKPDEASWNAVQQLYNRLLDAEQNATDAATDAANSAAAAAKSAEDAVTNAQKVIDDGIVKVNVEIDKGIAKVDAEVVKAEEYANISKTYSDNAAKSAEDAEQYAQYASQSAADAEAVVRDIYEIIPADASAENKLTTESFVNSSIATNTATFRGTYDLTAEQLNALPWQNTNPTGNYYCDNNDYVFLTTKKDGQVIAYSRYKCVIAASTITWAYEYTLNNSSFTDEQWAAINSGITAEIVNSIPKIHNLSDGTVTGALNQLFDGGNTLDFTGKNPNAVAAGLLAKLGESDITKLTRGATGQYASSFGGKSIAKGKRGHAEGTSTIAAGNYSHAEGDNSVSLGNDSHAEGYQTTAQGNMSHSEGAGTVSEGTYSHAEGLNTKAGGSAAHSEGTGTSAPGAYAHAEGQATTASGTAAHASGTNTKASGNNSTATGLNTEASGDNATSEGNTTKASGNESHAEGNQNEARGAHSHVEGEKNIIYTDIAVSGGGGSGGGATGGGDTPGGDTPGGDDNPNYLDEHKGDNAHSEGWNNQTLGYGSHAEGGANKSWGHFSHVEGTQNTTGALVADGANYKISGGEYAHAEGAGNTAIGICAHAEGNGTKASGANAHSEGYQSNAEGENSHAGGNNATARGRNSMAHGSYCVARKANQHIFGQSLDSINLEEGGAAVGILNESQANDLFEVGNGTSATTRSNAFRVLKDGRAKVQTAPTEDDDVVRKMDLANVGTGMKVVELTGSSPYTIPSDILPDLVANPLNYALYIFGNTYYCTSRDTSTLTYSTNIEYSNIAKSLVNYFVLLDKSTGKTGAVRQNTLTNVGDVISTIANTFTGSNTFRQTIKAPAGVQKTAADPIVPLPYVYAPSDVAPTEAATVTIENGEYFVYTWSSMAVTLKPPTVVPYNYNAKLIIDFSRVSSVPSFSNIDFVDGIPQIDAGSYYVFDLSYKDRTTAIAKQLYPAPTVYKHVITPVGVGFSIIDYSVIPTPYTSDEMRNTYELVCGYYAGDSIGPIVSPVNVDYEPSLPGMRFTFQYLAINSGNYSEMEGSEVVAFSDVTDTVYAV